MFKQGTGLGLSICKTIISILKGEIGVESKEGKGVYFLVYYPLLTGKSLLMAGWIQTNCLICEQTQFSGIMGSEENRLPVFCLPFTDTLDNTAA